MKRPEHWYSLPYAIQIELVKSNSVELEYDSYESSRSEAMWELLNYESYETKNSKIIQCYYESLKDEELLEMAIQCLSNTKISVQLLTDFIR